MNTDYEITGKLYKKLDSYKSGNGSQSAPYEKSFYYFGSSIQFKTCKSFQEYLQAKHPYAKFKVCISKH